MYLDECRKHTPAVAHDHSVLRLVRRLKCWCAPATCELLGGCGNCDFMGFAHSRLRCAAASSGIIDYLRSWTTVSLLAISSCYIRLAFYFYRACRLSNEAPWRRGEVTLKIAHHRFAIVIHAQAWTARHDDCFHLLPVSSPEARSITVNLASSSLPGLLRKL